MELGNRLMATPINPNNFPAKLWRLVNSPKYQSVRWDLRGEAIIIDQKLFESELFAQSEYSDEFTEQFKTSNFTSIVRQLNLYGFRKVEPHSDGGQGNVHAGGGIGSGDGVLHHFHNMYFKRDHPELLINLKRLTKANKEKLSHGEKVISRPPSRFQRLFNTLVEGNVKSEKPGPVNTGQVYQPFHRGNLAPYTYLSPSPHTNVKVVGLDRTPIPSHPWQNSAGLMTGQMESSSFSKKVPSFPVVQHFPNEVPYTLQSSNASVRVQQGFQGITTSGKRYSNYVPPPAEYHHTYYPPALQCWSSSAHMDSGTGHDISSSTCCSSCKCYRNQASQSSIPEELLHSSWHRNSSSENRKIVVNLENVFQTADELNSSPKLGVVKMNTAGNEISTSPSEVPQLPSSPIALNISPSKTVAKELESLNPVVFEATSFIVDFDQQEASCLPQNASFEYTIPATQEMENTVAAVSTYSTIDHTTAQLQTKQPSPYTSCTSAAILEEQPLNSEKLQVSKTYSFKIHFCFHS
ncbi:heat shock factor protein 5 [Protopterus annectens]|uniref:heat shock factor protein 5 n=1 Tax=Protopterus annectens TaxID=7888 RepID=UPI001CF9560C|nr:heat shock factor protein 5 [Protopterus annectens]